MRNQIVDKTSLTQVAVIIILFLVLASPVYGQQLDPKYITRGTKGLSDTKSSRISSGLNQLSIAGQTRSLQDLTGLATENQISLRKNSILVTVWVEEQSDIDPVYDFLESKGGEISATLDYSLEAWIPLNKLDEISSNERIRFICQSPRLFAYALPSSVTSEGVAVTRVQRLHEAGTTGKGVTIGIMDMGFKGLAEAQRRGDLPRNIPTRAFSPHGLEGSQQTVHGTACAEIIHDMAPDAKLVLAQVENFGEMINAVQWFQQQGVQIISFSAGSKTGPFDGRARYDRFVDEVATQQNILWVVSAGNEAENHWGGSFRDNDRDGFLDFSPGDETINMEAAGGPLIITVIWDDWGENPDRPSSSQDYDILILDQNGNPVARGDTKQNGRQPPIEFVGANDVRRGTKLQLAIYRTQASRAVDFHVFISGATINPYSSRGSVANPATARSALTVGAIHWQNKTIESFSSQGPTDDGRIKPDVSAPDAVKTVSYGADPFYGTSAAAPHVAGFAALLRQMHGPIPQSRLKELTMKFVEDLGASGLDPLYGAGLINGEVVKRESVADGGGEASSVSAVVLESLNSMMRDGTLMLTLQRLGDLTRNSEFAIKLVANRVGDPPVYYYGSRLKIGFVTNRNSHVVLLHLDADGNWHYVFPRGSDRLLRVYADQKILYPALGLRGLLIGPPPGIDRFYCLAFAEAVDLRKALRGDTGNLRGKVAIATLEIETRE